MSSGHTFSIRELYFHLRRNIEHIITWMTFAFELNR